MKVTKIYCDVCNKEITTEVPLKFEGYVTSNTHGWLFRLYDAVCYECRAKIITSVREAFETTVKNIQNERTNGTI